MGTPRGDPPTFRLDHLSEPCVGMGHDKRILEIS